MLTCVGNCNDAGGQIPGYDTFRASAAGTTEELRNTFDLFLDLLEFKETTLALLHEIPVDMMEFKVAIAALLFCVAEV